MRSWTPLCCPALLVMPGQYIHHRPSPALNPFRKARLPASARFLEARNRSPLGDHTGPVGDMRIPRAPAVAARHDVLDPQAASALHAPGTGVGEKTRAMSVHGTFSGLGPVRQSRERCPMSRMLTFSRANWPSATRTNTAPGIWRFAISTGRKPSANAAIEPVSTRFVSGWPSATKEVQTRTITNRTGTFILSVVHGHAHVKRTYCARSWLPRHLHGNSGHPDGRHDDGTSHSSHTAPLSFQHNDVVSAGGTIADGGHRP